MQLFLDILRATIAFAIRFGALLFVLFGIHLLVTRAVPQLARTAELLEQEPLVASELRQLTLSLEQEQREAATLNQRLVEAREQQREVFSASLATWQERIEGLRAQRQRLERQLQDLVGERAKYCDTYNPLKRWFCREVDARTAELQRTLAPVVAEIATSLEQAEAAMSTTRRKIAALEQGDPRALGEEGGTMVALSEQIAESAVRARELRDRVKDAQERRARVLEVARSPAGYLLRQWQAVGQKLVWIALIALLLPHLQRTLWYFVVMPVAERARPLRLSEPTVDATLVASPAQRTLSLSLTSGTHLLVRAGYARPVEGRTRSQLLYRWTAPFVSYSAGLVLLTRLLAARQGQAPTRVTLSSPSDPHSYLLRVELVNHPGVVLHPRHLVGVEGDIELRTVWRVLSFHAWATGQLRYVLLAGTGALVLEGLGDIVASELTESRAKIEQELVVGFDARLRYRTARTETFLPYLFGKTALVDDVFEGNGIYFWQKTTSQEAKSVAERGFDAVFGAIGKLLGF